MFPYLWVIAFTLVALTLTVAHLLLSHVLPLRSSGRPGEAVSEDGEPVSEDGEPSAMSQGTVRQGAEGAGMGSRTTLFPALDAVRLRRVVYH